MFHLAKNHWRKWAKFWINNIAIWSHCSDPDKCLRHLHRQRVSSVTRWLDCVFTNWPLITMNFCLLKMLYKSWLKILPKTKLPKLVKMTNFFYQSRAFSSNLVTLWASIKHTLFCQTKYFIFCIIYTTQLPTTWQQK